MDWRQEYRHKLVSTPDEAVQLVESGDRVFFQQGHCEARSLLAALMRRREELKDVWLHAHKHWGPADYCKPGMEGHFKSSSNFLGDTNRRDAQAGRVEYLPMYYYETDAFYRTEFRPDVFFLMLSAPDETGRCSFGLGADYSVACAQSARKVIVQINPSMPWTCGSYFDLKDAAAILEWDEPIVEISMGTPGALEEQMARYIAPLIHDGDCLQLGIGGVPDALLAYLKDKRDLGIHSELFSDGVVDLCRAGVITNRRKNYNQGKLVANFLLGSRKLFDFVDHNPDVLMLPVGITNDPREIAKNDNMVSINSCLQIDLFGQVNSETINGKEYGGIGGQVDFVRGARMSKGGRSILTVKSTAKQDTLSNIVCTLPPQTVVTTSRYDVQYVCSEYGIVNLHGKMVQERAQALIGLAHPKFRDGLRKQAKEAGILF